MMKIVIQPIKNSHPVALAEILKRYQVPNRVTTRLREYQVYGRRLAEDLGETARQALYIKLAKTEKRHVLEKAKYFVRDAPNVRSKGKLFMWALGKIRRGESLYKKST